ncbi:hypothetical protein PUNSTDRAFT_124074 [Punctularia strigosozonata HHB-11173 SS5]|uniref:uncharacterized protein n=1 Tax=Punctularia strigosozonata (strain HHB-11173) TaxID=741275 RepID=UPI0004416286|nr:uncharacterized protein PUNSTDRAFT_124074 [Punctularia strigosozonata HHB-11173 SS5]EIN14605.1 hypothetical protein PUNSTDRAFT_124074 [Punctularia strigosozonata HHB-11173 SS5]
MSSSYFSSFISKRKGLKNITLPGVRRIPNPPSPASFVSPAILDINDAYDGYDPSPPTAGEVRLAYEHYVEYNQPPSDSSRLQVDFNHAPSARSFSELHEREPSAQDSSLRKFSDDTVKNTQDPATWESGSDPRSAGPSGSGSGSASGWGTATASASTSDMSARSPEAFGSPSVEDVIVVSPESTEDFVEFVSEEGHDPSHLRGGSRKHAPLPLRIPASGAQLPRRASASNLPSAAPISARSRPASMDSAEALSAISGTTLARAMASTFVFPDDTNINRRSRHRSGLVRQDSATLPRGDQPLLNSPYWRLSKASMGSDFSPLPSGGLDVPPVPPLPSMPATPELGLMIGVGSGARIRRGSDAREQPLKSAEVKRRSSLSSLSRSNGNGNAEKPETGYSYPRPVSRISEVDSPAPSGPSAPNTPMKSLPNSATLDQVPSSASYYGSSEQGSPLPSQGSLKRKSRSGPATPERQVTRRSTGEPSSSGSNDYLNHILDEYATPSPRSSRVRVTRSPRSSVNGGKGTLSTHSRSSTRNSRTSTDMPSTKRGGKRVSNRILLPLGENSTALQRRMNESSRSSSLQPARIRSQLPSVPSSAYSRSSTVSSARASQSQHVAIDDSRASPDLLDTMLLPIGPSAKAVFNRQRSGSTPNPITVVRDSKDFNLYNITLSDGTETDGTSPSAGSGSGSAPARDQRFPETPSAFSPLWSPGTEGAQGPVITFGGEGSLPIAFEMTMDESRPLARSMTVAQDRGSSFRRPRLARSATASKASGMTRQMIPASVEELEDEDEDEKQAESLPPPPLPPSLSLPGTPLRSSPVTVERSPAQANAGQTLQLVGSTASLLLAQHSRASSVDAPSSRSSSPRPLPRKPLPGVGLGAESSRASQSRSRSPAPSELHLSSRDPSPERVRGRSPLPMPPKALPITPDPAARPNDVAGPSNASTFRDPLADALQSTINVNTTEDAELPGPGSSQADLVAPTTVPARPTPPRTVPDTSRLSAFPSIRSLSPESTTFVPPPPYEAAVQSEAPAVPVQPVAPAPPAASVQPDGRTPPAFGRSITEPAVPTSASSPRSPMISSIASSPSKPGSPDSRRTRARAPLGPRRPSAMANITNRERNGSVSSVTSTPGSRNMTGSSLSGQRNASASVHVPTPKFEPSVVEWKGLTLEAAKWTFTSSQLQAIVSRAIKQSAEASSIRLLPLDTLDVEIPDELRRLKLLSKDLKTKYKISVRKRATLFDSLTSGSSDLALVQRTAQELAEVSATLDQLSEELYIVTDQITQLNRLRDVHSYSALAMALRKLNTSFLSQVAETQALRQQVAQLETERDEAWRQAEDVAQEFDTLNEKLMEESVIPASVKVSGGRSSRVTMVRKNSVRAARAGLRTSGSVRRSMRSSMGSAYAPSSAGPSTSRSTMYSDIIPPVPPVPRPSVRTSDVPTRGSYASGDATPASDVEANAMIEAQKELYAMLGLATQDNRQRGRPRSQSVRQSGSGSFTSRPKSVEGSDRPASLPPTPGFAKAIDPEGRAMLATMGMIP